jgi:hypothetical protein
MAEKSGGWQEAVYSYFSSTIYTFPLTTYFIRKEIRKETAISA